MNLSSALEVAGRTDVGCVRSHNEDAIYCDPANGLVILADGMGGHNAGEVASGMLTTLLAAELGGKIAAAKGVSLTRAGQEETCQLLAHEIIRANTAIYQAAQKQPQYAGMGTTLVTAIFSDNRVWVAHVGDSRLYRLRSERLEAITRDHSLLQEQIDSGLLTPEEARLSQHRNLVTRAVGVESSVEPEVHSHEVLPGDVYLLCSDGLNDMVEDKDIAAILHSHAAQAEDVAIQLVNQAIENGGRDNVSVILVRIKQPFPVNQGDRGWLQRFMTWLK